VDVGADTDREDVSGGSKLCQLAVWRVRSGIGAGMYCGGTGIEPLLDRRAKSELCNRFGPLGDHGSDSSGSPVVASTNKWNCEASANGSVGESHVCGLVLLEPPPRPVGLIMVVSGNVRARVGETSKGGAKDASCDARPWAAE
jgi:hypothetical protein